MKCDVCRDNFTAYLEGDLTEVERAESDAHLASCPDCTATLREFEATVSLLRSLPAVELPAGLAERITAAVRAEKLPEIVPRRTRSWWELASGLAAAAALLIGVMFWTHWGLRPQPMPGPTPPPSVEREATPMPETPAPEAEASAPTRTETVSKGTTPASAARTEAHPARERHPRVATTPPTRSEAPIVGHAPKPPSAPAPAPMPVRTAFGGGTGVAEVPEGGPAGPAGVAPGMMAKSFEADAMATPGAPSALKVARGAAGMRAMSAAPVQGGVQLQVLPPANCVVGEPAWLSIGVTSDIRADEAQIRVLPITAVELVDAPDGVVYRGALERAKTVRVPVEIVVSRPGTARLRVVLHAEKPELNSALSVTTPSFAPAPAGQAPRDPGHIEVRLSFDEEPLRDAFMEIGRSTGVRVIPGEAVDRRPVTVDFGRGVPLPAALRILADVGDCEVVHSRDTYRIEARQHPDHSH